MSPQPPIRWIAAPYTPLTPDGRVQLDAIDHMAAVLADGGVDGAFVCGTTGEGVSLTVAERQAVAERWRRAAPEGFAVIVHVGGTCLPDCRQLAAHADTIGADAVAAMAPPFYRPRTIDELADWCAAIARAAPRRPFYYYHIPFMTGVDLPLAALLPAIARRVGNLAGAKFTHEDLLDFARTAVLDDGRYELLWGRDEFLLAGLAMGARGAVGTSYTFAAPLYRRIAEAFAAGDWPAARREQARAAAMMDILARHGGIPAGKEIMRMVGLDCGPPRAPFAPLPPERVVTLREELEGIDFFGVCLRG